MNNEDKVLINMSIGQPDYHMKVEIPFHQPYFSKNKIDGAIGGNLMRCYENINEDTLTKEFLSGANYGLTYMYQAMHNWLQKETGASNEDIDIKINSIFDEAENCCLPNIDVNVLGQSIEWFDLPPDGGEEMTDTDSTKEMLSDLNIDKDKYYGIDPDRIPEPEDALIKDDRQMDIPFEEEKKKATLKLVADTSG